MLDISVLKELLHQKQFTNTEKLLLCLSFEVDKPKAVSEIKEIAKKSGFRKAKDWNISSYLGKTNGLAIRVDKGWELTNSGKKRVSQLSGAVTLNPTPKISANLRSHLARIKDTDTVAFLDEAIRCYESKLYRAAIVMSWVGAASLLYDYVINNKLNAFNTEAVRRDPKWKAANKKDDLSKMKEYNFLQILCAISVLGKSVKDELEACLKLRNGCGHPNSLKVGESRVASHIETLMLNVFSKY
ncbi:MAG: hypothetical protein COA63_008275 [Methylophaga sp.]|nr:hypothetical protein [Methylophaga sp.]